MVYWKNMIASHYLFPILKSTIKTWSFQVFKASMISWHDFMALMISWELFLAPPPVAYSSFFLLFPPPPLLLPSWFHWTWWFHTPKWHSSSWANKSRGPKWVEFKEEEEEEEEAEEGLPFSPIDFFKTLVTDRLIYQPTDPPTDRLTLL